MEYSDVFLEISDAFKIIIIIKPVHLYHWLFVAKKIGGMEIIKLLDLMLIYRGIT